MDLPDETLEVFGNFSRWLYDTNTSTRTHFEFEGTTLPGHCLAKFVKLYIFADKYDIPNLKVQICDGVIDMRDNHSTLLPTLGAVAMAYQHLPPGCALRRLLVDWYAWDVSFYLLKQSEVNLDPLHTVPDFAAEVVLAMAKIRSECPSGSEDPFWGLTGKRYEGKARQTFP